MAVKNLYQRNGVWYYRKIVPSDLVNEYPGCKDLRGSLGTKDKREAERRLRTKLAELDAEFEGHHKARREAAERLAEDARRVAAEKAFLESPAFVRAVKGVTEATRGMSEIFEHGDHRRMREPTREEATVMVDARPERLSPPLRDMLIEAFMNSASIEEEDTPENTLTKIKDALAQNQYDRIHKTSFVDGHHEDGEASFVIPPRFVISVREYLIGLLDAEEKTIRAKQAAIEARSNEHEEESGFILELYEDWIRERNPAEKTKGDVRKAIKHFEDVNARLRFTEVTHEHVIKFKNHLLSLENKAQTKSKFWSMLRVVFTHAVGNRKLMRNPFDGISFKPPEDGTVRQTFTKFELGTISKSLESKKSDWWLFRICLYTGARLGEIHQLTRVDVRTDEGILYLHLSEEGDGQSLKTENSRRAIPVHRKLIEDGFEAFLPGTGKLFPNGTKDAASKRLNRAIRDAGVTDEGKVVHSARHTFKSACRAAGLDEDTHDRLTGHKSSHVGRNYGTHSIASLKAAIDKVQFGIE